MLYRQLLHERRQVVSRAVWLMSLLRRRTTIEGREGAGPAPISWLPGARSSLTD
jgi:hypothetical protein